jgi:dehydrogenase/reductase SDR family protein 7B
MVKIRRSITTELILFNFVIELLKLSSVSAAHSPFFVVVPDVSPTRQTVQYPRSSAFSINSKKEIKPHSSVKMVQQQTKEYFRDKKVLLTGASGGLGRAFAVELAGCGVAGLVLSGRKINELQKLAKEIQNQSSNIIVHTISADLSDPESVQELGKQTLERFGKVDVLINNGGVSSRSRFIETKIDVDAKVMQINFLAGAALAKIVVPGMIETKSGSIIWISSVQGLVGIPNRTSYAASKFAVQGYCESLRAELQSSNISVHCVSPGYINTGLSLSAITGDGATHGKMDATTAAGADPQMVAEEILDKVAAGQQDFTVAATLSAKAAIWMRFLCPWLLQQILVKRYEKSLVKEKEE